MIKVRHPISHRERRQMLWLLVAVPVLMLLLIYAHRMLWEAPKFPIPPGTQILQCRHSPLAAIGGSAYVQRVQSSLSPAQFWAQTRPLLEAKGLKSDTLMVSCGPNYAEIRDDMQQKFRIFGLTQIVPLTMSCTFSKGTIEGKLYYVFMWPHQSGTMAEFWIR